MNAEDQEKSFTRNVPLNLVTNIMRVLVTAIIGFLMVPYYIGKFGISGYAMIPLATTITMYVLVISDSLSESFSRYMTITTQNNGDMSRVYSSSVLGMSKCMFIFIPACFIISILAPYMFDIGTASPLDVQVMFALVMSSFILISFTACTGSVFMAYNKIYITSIDKTIYISLQTALVLVFFEVFGPSLALIGISYIISVFVMITLMHFQIRRVAPELRIKRDDYESGLLKRMFKLGLWATAGELGALLFVQTSLVSVNLFLGATAEGLFSIIANVISMVDTATTALVAVSVPLAYRNYAQNDIEGLSNNLKLFTKFVGLLMVAPLALLFIFTPHILTLWIGSGYEEIYDLIRIVCIAEVAICASKTLIVTPMIYEKTNVSAIATIVLGCLCTILTALFLAMGYGLDAAVAVWAVTLLLLRFGFYPIFSSRLMNISKLAYIKPILICYIAYACTVATMYAINVAIPIPVRWVTVIGLFAAVFVPYILVSFRTMYSKSEKMLLKEYFPEKLTRFLI